MYSIARIVRTACLVLALVAAPGAALAADTALLIGVGKFSLMPSANLPGIDRDIDMMKGVVNRLGYSQVIEMHDEDATRRAILDRLERLLVTEASPSDRVLIYFSGHGTRLGVDEGNGQIVTHSAIVAADAQITENANGTSTMRGVLVGKEFADLFRRARVKSVILVVDACHSGSIDKAVRLGRPVLGSTNAVRKFLVWPGMPANKAAALDKAVGLGLRQSAGDSVRYVSMAAAGDEESALAMPGGSVFTAGITQAIAERSANGQISPREAVRLASDYIAREVPKSNGEVFHPEVHGGEALMDAPMRLTDTSDGGGPNWRQLLDVAGGLPRLTLSGLQPRYVDGEEVRMQITVPTEGYLNILAVGPDDTVTLLYPNQNVPENHVLPGTLSLPVDIPKVNGQEIYFPVTAPYGKTLIAAILTRAPMNLARSAVDANSGKALYTPSLAGLKQLEHEGDATRAVAVGVRNAGNVSAWGVAVEAQTCSARGC